MESNRELIYEFINMMKDRRYIRHNGKPVLLVYRIKLIPHWLETAAMWRRECRKAGIGEIHLCSIRFG
ncbi:glycoside hydrolase family 99-like domain-containing protein, partial [Limnospira indica]